MREVAPLSKGFLITSMVGFLVSAVFIYPKDPPWGFTFSLVFMIMFISAMISTTYASVEMEYAIEKKNRNDKNMW